jgi:threonine synthase
MNNAAFQQCMKPGCRARYAIEETKVACTACGSLLDIRYDWDKLPRIKSLSYFEHRWGTKGTEAEGRADFSGVWRFRELLPFYRTEDDIVTIGEGRTVLQQADILARNMGMNPHKLLLQYEGLNPSGSFKDNGMTAAFTHARMVGAKRVACASTGNTSASLAVFCSATGLMRAIIFIGSGKISYGKLAQALDHGALTVQITGDFDDAMQRVQEVSRKLGIYLVNSVNPFRLEGQKTIMYRILEAMRWEVPDWIVVPGGNLGNVSAFGKAFIELMELGLIKRPPRLAVINAAGANTFFQLYERFGLRWQAGQPDRTLIDGYFRSLEMEKLRAATIASAIEINHPVNLNKALRALDRCGGVVREATDQEILDAKAKVGAGGLGCEPASAASVAGARKLRREGIIAPSDRVVCILTGHQLKDPTATVAYHSTDQKTFDDVLGHRGVRRATYANRAVQVPNDLDEIIKAIEVYS